MSTSSTAPPGAAGSAKVWIDGVRQDDLSFHADRTSVKINGNRAFKGLASGEHTIKIEVKTGAAYVEGFTVTT